MITANRFADRIPDVIKAAREKRKLSQNNLADRMACARPYISRIESGKFCPTLPMLTRLADALGTTPCALLWNAQLLAEKKANETAA